MSIASALPLDLLVQVNSQSVGGATFTISKLPTLLITKTDDTMPNPQFSEFSSASAVKQAFKKVSVGAFADKYFGFTSKNATKCDSLSVFQFNEAPKPATLKGVKAPSLTALKSMKGKASISIDGVAKVLTLDFTSSSDSLSACATIIQTALQAADSGDGFKKATCEFNAYTNGFVIKSGTDGENGSVGFFTKPTGELGDGNTDLSEKLGLSESEGATILNGLNALTLESALNLIDKRNGKYAVITFDFEFDTLKSDLAIFGAFLKNANCRFLGVYSDSKLKDEDLSEFAGYDGLVADYKVGEAQNGLVCAFFSSIDFSKANSNVNVAFNDMSEFSSVAIVDESDFETLKNKRVNAPCKFGILGQNDTRYMNGDVWGSLTSSANVYFANIYIKISEQVALYNMLSSGKMLGIRDIQTQNTANGYLTEAFESFVSANIISVGAELKTSEKSSISQAFGNSVDDIENVYSQIQNYGYFFIITAIDPINKQITISQAYMANAPVRSFVINNYILGA